LLASETSTRAHQASKSKPLTTPLKKNTKTKYEKKRSHQRDREAELAPSPTHLEDAHGRASSGDEFVTPQMRLIVASWVVEVAEEFGLQQETLHLSVALLDRFLSATRGVPRGVLQLAAVAAVLVASKEQEVSHPSVGRLTAISANCFRSEDLLRMERILLDALDFRVAGPTAFTFLHLYAQALAVMAGGGGTGGGGGMGGGGGAARQQCAQLVGQAQQQQVQGHEEGAQQQSQQQQRRQQLAFGGAIAPAPAAAPAAAQAPPSSSSPSSLLCPSTSATYTAAYLVELAMLDYAMLAYPPSVLAAAALVVGALTAAESQQGQQAAAGPGADSAAAPPPLAPQQLAARLALVSGFPPAALQSCTAALLRLHRAAAWPESPAAAELLLPVRAKFGADAWCRAAHAAPLAALPAPLFRC